MSFDIYIPADYIIEDTVDVVIQMTPNDGNLGEKRNPPLAIFIQNGKWTVAIRAIKKKKGLESDKVLYDIIRDIIIDKDVELGKWHHFDIYYKEGYMLANNPWLKVLLDGKVVAVSNSPNAYNVVESGDSSHGIYKAQWVNGEMNSNPDKYIAENKIVYFDNFKIWI